MGHVFKTKGIFVFLVKQYAIKLHKLCVLKSKFCFSSLMFKFTTYHRPIHAIHTTCDLTHKFNPNRTDLEQPITRRFI